MSRNPSLCVAVVLTMVGVLSVGSASAASITIPNASFEEDVLENGATTTATTLAGDWATSGDWAGAWNPLGSDAPDSAAGGFLGASGNGTPSGGSGANVLALVTHDGTWTLASSNHPTATLQPGIYTLTVAAGSDGTDKAFDTYEIGFGTVPSGSSGVSLVTYTGLGSDLPIGALADRSLTLTVASDNAHLGEALQIAFYGNNTSGGTQLIAFDNVRLDFTPVPEPSAVVLLVSGVLGLLAYAWKKRT